IGDLSALSAADAVASFSGRVDQTIPKRIAVARPAGSVASAPQAPTAMSGLFVCEIRCAEVFSLGVVDSVRLGA
ncbi:hypothetical protein KW404_18805, partial [Xanthomonas vasicola pv. vasculorum]|uniref:hypothetical protein n=1 Tax=Xanthomonas vasicola TaxID=56459 RepID=UPI001C442B95